MNSEDFRKRQMALMNQSDEVISGLDKVSGEAGRVKNIIKNTSQILDDLDEQFCKQTGLTVTDMRFLFVAIGLQCARQYLLTQFPQRLDDQSSARLTLGHGEEHSDRQHRYYNPSLEEIITNPVPFDANIGANGALSGGGRLGHRVTAIGHDPLLGLIFGTANIATATLTNSSFESYHIYTNDNGRDFFKNHARTDLVLSHTANKLLKGGNEGKIIVGISLMKEIIHLNSDLNTKNSLPLPVVTIINPKVASSLAEFGLDMANVVAVGKQASYAMLINSVIAMIHGLFLPEGNDCDRKLYEVRTRKILSYSNLVASTSNIVAVTVTKNMKILDLGGLLVTIYQLITNADFIKKVKEEFVFGSYRKMINGDY